MKCILLGKLLTNSNGTYFPVYLLKEGQFGCLLCLPIIITGIFFFLTSSLTNAQIEVSVNENLLTPFENTLSENAVPAPDILYSKLNDDSIVGEVQNNFSYPIEQVRLTATVYDKNGVIVATGDKYINDYLLKPGERSGFNIFLDETLPTGSKYTLTTSLKKSEDVKPPALRLSVGNNYRTSNSFRVLGEVMNQGNNSAHAVKVSAIFYDGRHNVIDTDYVYTNPDIISPNKKAPFEFSFRVNNPEKIRSMAFNVQSDEYSLVVNNPQKS